MNFQEKFHYTWNGEEIEADMSASIKDTLAAEAKRRGVGQASVFVDGEEILSSADYTGRTFADVESVEVSIYAEAGC